MMPFSNRLRVTFVIAIIGYVQTHEACSNGTRKDKDTNECVACEPGHYLISPELHNITSCTRCADRWFQPNFGQDHCLVCVHTTGFLESSTDRTFCKYNCWLGSYFNRTTEICLECPAGTYTDTLGSESCMICPAGKTTVTGSGTSINDCVVDIPITTSTSTPLATTFQTSDKAPISFVSSVPKNIYESTATTSSTFNLIYVSQANSLMPSTQTLTFVTSAYTDVFSGISEFFKSSRNAALFALPGGLIIGAGIGICIHAFVSRRQERVIYVERSLTSDGVSKTAHTETTIKENSLQETPKEQSFRK